MKKSSPRAENLRRALAQEAARVMAEHGVRDYRFAKRKAAERFGVIDEAVLPRNTEIEAALLEYQRLFAAESHEASRHPGAGGKGIEATGGSWYHAHLLAHSLCRTNQKLRADSTAPNPHKDPSRSSKRGNEPSIDSGTGPCGLGSLQKRVVPGRTDRPSREIVLNPTTHFT